MILFLSYSRKDKKIMERVEVHLERRRLDVWTDKYLVPGEASWQHAIDDAIQDCDVLVVLLSPDSKASEWVEREISLANLHKKPVVPLLIRGSGADSVPLALANANWIDARKDLERGLNRLVEELPRILDPTLPPLQKPVKKKHPLIEMLLSLLDNQQVINFLLGGVLLAILWGIAWAITQFIPPEFGSTPLSSPSPSSSVVLTHTPEPAPPSPTSRVILETSTAPPTFTPYPTAVDPSGYALQEIGIELWHVALDDALAHMPAYGVDGYVYALTQAGTFYILQAGEIKAQHNLGEVNDFDYFSPPVVAPNGRVYQVFGGVLYTFDANGTRGWETGAAGNSPPVFDEDSNAYLMDTHSRLYGFSAYGTKLWVSEECGAFGGGIWPNPVVYDGLVYANCSSRIYALDANTGGLVWELEVDFEGTYARLDGRPAVDGQGQVYATDSNGTVFAFSPTGEQRWSTSPGFAGSISEYALTGAQQGGCYALIASQLYYIDSGGTPIWQSMIGGLGFEGMVFVADNADVFSSNTDEEISWVRNGVRTVLETGASETVTPVYDVENGILYLGLDNLVVAVQIVD